MNGKYGDFFDSTINVDAFTIHLGIGFLLDILKISSIINTIHFSDLCF